MICERKNAMVFRMNELYSFKFNAFDSFRRPCMVCNTNNDDSYVGCMNPNVRISLSILSTGTAFRPCANACVQSNGVCV